MFLPLCAFLDFSSLLGVLSSNPAQMGRLRYIKRNRAIITFLLAFPWITCKKRNKSALNIQLKYYFMALIRCHDWQVSVVHFLNFEQYETVYNISNYFDFWFVERKKKQNL